MPLTKVTFTGIDNYTDPKALVNLYKEFPFIEFGVLLPTRPMGASGSVSRFPSEGKLVEVIGTFQMYNIPLAGHICPPKTELVLSGVPVSELYGSAFKRVQINTHGMSYTFISEEFFKNIVKDTKREYIIQLDGISDYLLENPLVNTLDRVHGLYDLSAGEGIVPTKWITPKLGTRYMGYAGGLGPENLAQQLALIEEASKGINYWIDMETRVRTYERFDLGLVRKCCEIVQEFLSKRDNKRISI